MSLFPPEQRARSWIIPNEANLPANLQSKRGRRVLAAAGRLVPQKGFDLLLEALARIAAAQPDWTLVIWGEGPERAALELQGCMLGLDGRVQLAGVSERPGLWIETADAFVFSSRYEGWGIVLLEAMAAGLPVVSFDCRFGPSEMITHEEDGLLVPNGDVHALSAAMSRLMGSETLRKSLGEAAAKSARRFSRERVKAGWDEVVKSAVEHDAGDMRRTVRRIRTSRQRFERTPASSIQISCCRCQASVDRILERCGLQAGVRGIFQRLVID